MEIEKLQLLIGKKVKAVRDLTENRTDSFQLTFEDGSVLIVWANTDGYEYEGIEVKVYEP